MRSRIRSALRFRMVHKTDLTFPELRLNVCHNFELLLFSNSLANWSTFFIMPRHNGSEKRTRIAKACILCQTHKTKCDGLCPCGQCIKRERSSTCSYSSHRRLYGRQRPWPKEADMDVSRETKTTTIKIEETQDDRLDPGLRERDGIHIAIPKVPNTMRDTKGRAST
ncbi:hypothetical protein V8C44DRAFT_319806 [Trichoderma aethiopicum]